MNYNRYPCIIITVVILAFILTACNFGREPAPTPLPLTVPTTAIGFNIAPETLTVQQGDVTARMVVDAKGALGAEEDLFFGADGRVQTVHVQSGDEVAAGDIIAELNTRDFSFDVDLAEAEVDLAELQLEKARQVNVYTFDDAVFEVAIADLQLRELLADRGATPEDVEIQRIRLERAQALVEHLEASFYTGSSTDVDRLTVEFERAKVRLAKQRALFGDLQITAPLAGEVRLFDALEAGKTAQAYAPVGVIVDPQSLVIEANLVNEELEPLHEGMPVQVRLPNSPDELLLARIRHLPQPFGSGVGLLTQVTLRRNDDLALIHPGMSVKIVVELERAEDTLWLPPSALRGFTGNYYVEKKEGNTVRETPVTIGLRNEEQVQILSGLEEGDQVVGESP